MKIPPYVSLLTASAAIVFLRGAPAPAIASVTTSDRIAAFASQHVGKTTAEAGSWVDPRVSCAATTWWMLKGAGVVVPKTASVTTNGGLVKALLDAGWQFVPRSQARPGDVVWHDRNGTAGHGPEHIGLCSNKGCTTAFNTKDGKYMNNDYPQRYGAYIDGGDRSRGGVLRAPS